MRETPFSRRQRERDRARRPGPSLFACLVSFCSFRSPKRPSRERTDRMTSQGTRDHGISNVETEYLEINSKEAWPILYQVKIIVPVSVPPSFFRFLRLSFRSPRPNGPGRAPVADVSARGTRDYVELFSADTAAAARRWNSFLSFASDFFESHS